MDPGACAVIPLVHRAFDDLGAAITAAKNGNGELMVTAGSQAERQADVMTSQLGSLGPGSSANAVLRLYLASAAIGLGQLGGLLADRDVSLADKVRIGGEGLISIEPALGSAEALAMEGACPGFVLSGSPLPTIQRLPTPSDGPIPSGTTADQTHAALSAIHLREAAGVEFRAEPRVRWLPKGGIVLRNLELTNRTSAAVSFPFDPTVLRWDGNAWTKQACLDPETTGHVRGLCGVVNANANQLAPGTINSEGPNSSLFVAWPGMTDIPPGTYALVVPIWRTTEEFPDTEPGEAVVAIVTITTSP